MAEFKRIVNKKAVPCCPNHGEPLEGVGSPIPRKGTGICPVSKCPFDFEIETDREGTEYVKDAAGNLTALPTFKVSGDE